LLRRGVRIDLFGVLGAVFGVLVAPLIFLVALLRRRRLFHGRGLSWRGEVTPCASDPRAQRIAARLRGFVLARLSASVTPGPEEVPDWLGGGFRFRADAVATAVLAPGDQDLLVASLASFGKLTRAKRETDVHDFLNNDYFAIAPYQVEGMGPAKVRLRGSRKGPQAGTRAERLRLAAQRGEAVFRLELQPTGERAWLAVADITLREPVVIDNGDWYMTPFHAGRGMSPRGFIHGIRLVAYPVGRTARRLRGG